MAEQTRRARTVTRRYRADIGLSWWGALVVVTVILGVMGRGDGGFWGAFLWSVVGFVVGTLVAIAISSRRVGPRTEDEAFADLDVVSGGGSAP
jgi:4-hydroxybenzoate polyprenyltransferase